MNENNFLDPGNEKFLQYLTKAFEKEKMSNQIKQMVSDKIKSTDFNDFKIPATKSSIWYRNPILNIMHPQKHSLPESLIFNP